MMIDAVLRSLAREQAEICRVFANPTRILILWSLAEQEKSVGEIAQEIGASLQSTSQHLRIMKQTKVLASRKDAQMVYYRISDSIDGQAGDGDWAGCPHLLQVVRLGATSASYLPEVSSIGGRK